MTTPRRALTVYPTLTAMRAEAGGLYAHFALCLENGRAYEWVVDDTTATNTETVLAATGGTPGRWLMVRAYERGANLTDANATRYVYAGRHRRTPAATRGASGTLTRATLGAAAGDVVTVTRLDTTAFTVAVVNGGVGAGTLVTLPVSVAAFADCEFDGTNWALLRAATIP